MPTDKPGLTVEKLKRARAILEEHGCLHVDYHFVADPAERARIIEQMFTEPE